MPQDCSTLGSSLNGILYTKILDCIVFLYLSRRPPNPGIKLRSPALQANSLPSEPPEKPHRWFQSSLNNQNVQIKNMFTYIYSITKRNIIYVQIFPEPNINHLYEFLKII